MNVNRKIIEIDSERCDGCGLCVPSCAEGAIQVIDGKARLVADKFCDGLGACLGECPNDALRVIEREAEDFDEVAVEHHLKEKEHKESAVEPSLPCGCPSAHVQSLGKEKPRKEALKPSVQTEAASVQTEVASALTNWPIQITLIPPTAPFLKGADLLVLADCVGVAYPNLHRDILAGKVVMMGCPKLDNAEIYIQKFVQIFKTADIRSITTVMMEVPCCSGLLMIIRKALAEAGNTIPLEQVVVGIRGKIQSGESPPEAVGIR
jgi:NAD-dependent dihydropyrimidine dehydrogenase PreA subunit